MGKSGLKWFFKFNYIRRVYTVLCGANLINLDAKGRLIMPSKYRDMLNNLHHDKLICTVDIGSSSLLLYPFNEWTQIANKLGLLSDMDPEQRAIKRLMLGYATECELDNNGRILISPTLRQYANLNKKIMLVGQLNKFEIWDEVTWENQIQESLSKINTDKLSQNSRLIDFSL